MKSPKFSICIPTWEQRGVGLRHLEHLIASINRQTFKDFELVISDHSQNDDIERFVSNLDCGILYKRNDRRYGNGVANLNDCLKMADGDLIKIMFQDDFMFSDMCLETIYNHFTEDDTWLVCGCNHTRDDGHTFERYFTPRWNDRLLQGDNTISSPSVLTIRNNDVELFDENLKMMMDVEYYYRLNLKFGKPKIIKECLITNRQHKHQISAEYDWNKSKDELLYLEKIYN